MRKDKLYFLTFISIAVIFLLIASISSKYFVKVSANQLIEVQLESSIREANEMARLVNYQLISGLEREKIIQNFQKAIENTNDGASFICLFDWSGKEVCHPDITQVGQKVNSNQSLLNSLKEENSSDELYNLLINREVNEDNDQNTQKNQSRTLSSEIVHIVPVEDSDLIIAAHFNIDKIAAQTRKLKTSFYTIFALMGMLIILSSFFAVRMIGSYYEKQLEQKNTNLESELVNLSKLNMDLVAYQQKITEAAANEVVKEVVHEVQEVKEPIENNPSPVIDSGKKRILTYIRNELIPIFIDQISHIYTENGITFVLTVDGKKSTTNVSLDDMFANLDPSLFFRANRQFIISITAIDKIIKYGNSQLKIVLRDTDAEIIISKNKASEFRQWLNI